MLRHWMKILNAGCRTATCANRPQRSLLQSSEVTQRGFSLFKGTLNASKDPEPPIKGKKVKALKLLNWFGFQIDQKALFYR
jgi:hypothetical protein